MQVVHEARHCFVLVVRLLLLLVLMLTKSIVLILGVRLFLATTLSNLGYTVMVAMNKKFTIWTGYNYGEFVIAEDVFIVGDTVSFVRDGKEVKRYDREEFLKNNPDWKLLENAE
jgi:hypothetical protein